MRNLRIYIYFCVRNIRASNFRHVAKNLKCVKRVENLCAYNFRHQRNRRKHFNGENFPTYGIQVPFPDPRWLTASQFSRGPGSGPLWPPSPPAPRGWLVWGRGWRTSAAPVALYYETSHTHWSRPLDSKPVYMYMLRYAPGIAWYRLGTRLFQTQDTSHNPHP